ncbi:MAG: isoprenylcysteine carboxylmethyltransferase family protein [Pyrinomonadaceae bacterium]
MERLLRYYLLLYLVAYFFAAFLWRSFMVRKRTGINPVVFKGSDDAHDFIGRVFKLLFALVAGVVLAYSLWPESHQYSVPIEWLDHTWLKWVGMALLFLSLFWTVLAQTQMGESWRIGIDREHQTPLVQSGIFRFSRNPIFLGMMFTLLGLFLVLPNVFTLLALVVGVVLIHIQVRLEEEFLSRAHGEDYASYCRRVRRWL